MKKMKKSPMSIKMGLFSVIEQSQLTEANVALDEQNDFNNAMLH
jgi:hypothetical protein